MVDEKYINSRRKSRPNKIGKRSTADPDSPAREEGSAPVYFSVSDYFSNPLEAKKEKTNEPKTNFKENLINLKLDPMSVKKKTAKPMLEKIKGRFKVRSRSLVTNSLIFVAFFCTSWLVSNGPSLIANLSFDVKDSGILENTTTGATAQNEKNATNYVGGPDKIIIKSIGVDAPMVMSNQTSEKGILKDLEKGVVHYGNTPLPGQAGNAVLFGHSSNFVWAPGKYKEVFAILGKSKAGDKIEIHYSGKRYVYKVTNIKTVSPKDVKYLKSSGSTPRISLITCTPTGTTWKRLVVEAVQISPEPTQAKSDKPHLPQL